MQILSAREMQIVKHIVKGCTAKEIARLIDLEYRTVERYISNIRKKLRARNVAHVVCIAIKKKLVRVY